MKTKAILIPLLTLTLTSCALGGADTKVAESKDSAANPETNIAISYTDPGHKASPAKKSKDDQAKNKITDLAAEISERAPADNNPPAPVNPDPKPEPEKADQYVGYITEDGDYYTIQSMDGTGNFDTYGFGQVTYWHIEGDTLVMEGSFNKNPTAEDIPMNPATYKFRVNQNTQVIGYGAEDSFLVSWADFNDHAAPAITVRVKNGIVYEISLSS